MAESDGREPMVGVMEAAKHLGLSTSTIYLKVSRGEIPHYKVGVSVRFRLSELDAWVKHIPAPTL